MRLKGTPRRVRDGMVRRWVKDTEVGHAATAIFGSEDEAVKQIVYALDSGMAQIVMHSAPGADPLDFSIVPGPQWMAHAKMSGITNAELALLRQRRQRLADSKQ